MKTDRVLIGEVREFLTTPSLKRDFITNYVRENLGKGTRSVALCFRGRAATLYYRCHRLLQIRPSRDGIVGEFDFRHARFTESYRQTLKRLGELHVDTSTFSDAPEQNARNIVRFVLEECDVAECKEILQTYRKLIDDFSIPKRKQK